MTDAPHVEAPTRSRQNPWEVKTVTVTSVTVLAVTTIGLGVWFASGCPLNLLTMIIALTVMPLVGFCLLGSLMFSFLASRAYQASLSGHLWATALATVLVVLECSVFILYHYTT